MQLIVRWNTQRLAKVKGKVIPVLQLSTTP
jgi:hypothetical protein